MRLYVRISKGTRLSLGPVALLILTPFLLAWWACYLILLATYLTVRLIVTWARSPRGTAGRRP